MSNILTPVLGQGQNGTLHINAALAQVATKQTYTVSALTTLTAAACNGALVACSNGAAGQPCLAYSDGTTWHQIALGAAISAT